MKRIAAILSPLLLVATIVVFHVVVRMLGREFLLREAIPTAYCTIIVMGLCLLMGFAGQVSFGQGAFFALGGYTTAILTTHSMAGLGAPWSEWLRSAGVLVARLDLYGGRIVTFSAGSAFLAALLLTFLVAWGVGVPALRLRGHYLAMATLGFGLIVYRLLLSSTLAGGADGLAAVPAWEFCDWLTIGRAKTHRIANYYFAWSTVVGVWLLLRNLTSGRPGRAWRAIHDNETAAAAMGVDTAGFKLRAFVLSAMLAAAAGSLMTHYNGGIGPDEASAMKSVRYVALVAAGGMVRLGGVLTVTAILTFLSLRGYFGSYDHAVFGAILIAVVSVAPDGLGAWMARCRRALGARPARERAP